ncbi:MAG: rod shape-determining protein MreD [Betaproteobacteria bacterium]|nr:rod shape-determining protein MreD [Betaproteobacteria bacterium]
MQYEPRPQRILLPVNPLFIGFTLACALAFNLLPWRDLSGMPDLVALVLAFWGVHQPRRVSVGIAFLLGIVMDVANGTLLGQHAFAYAVLVFTANALSRRLLWFPLWPQAMHVLFVLLGSQMLMVAVRMIAGSTFPGALYFLGSLISAVLWPVVTMLLLAPQRRPESVDENRPI